MKFVCHRESSFGRSRALVLGLLLVATVVAGLLAPLVWARPGAPSRDDGRIAVLVSTLMNRRHLSEMRVDDEISQRALEMFFKSLDSKKRYFYQSDIDEFSREKYSIDDSIKRGRIDLAKRIFDRFLQRVTERIAVAHRYADAEHDFTLDETLIRDPEKMAYATSPEEADERWRKLVKYDLLTQIADDTEYAEAVDKLHKRFRGILRNWEQTDNDELLEYFLTAVTMSFDPHSTYMAPSTLENFTIQMRLELNGIGASLQSEYGETIVREIVPGGAADKDGRLQIDDVISGVAQGDSEFVDIVEMKINNVVQLIRGKPGTIVRLVVTPADKSGRKILDITRARIELKDREARSEILERGDHVADTHGEVEEKSATGEVVEHLAVDGEKHKIGVIQLPSFYMDMEGRRAGNPNFKSTSRDLRRLLQEFNHENVDLVIMDLRFNGGGSLPESVDATGLFIDQGPVVQVKGPDGHVDVLPDDDPGMVWSGPLIVLINRFSASASEIFAGAIQDYGRGIIIGDRSTHGKGTVQQLFDLGSQIMPVHRAPNYGALKMTIQQFYRPGGDSTQNRGVVSDIELPYRTSFWKGIGEADLDYAMDFDRVAPLPHTNYRGAGANLIDQLQQRSSDRCKASDFFNEERRKIERYLERQAEETVTLNKEKFLAERAEVNSEKDQEEVFDNLKGDDRPVFPPTRYNDEVIAIALDYLRLLEQNQVAAVR